MKFIYKLLIGLSLTALPAVCASFTINNTNAANTWYGFYWNEMGSSGTCGSGTTYPCGTAFGNIITNSPTTGAAYLSTDSATTVLGSSPSGGIQVSSWAFDFSSPVLLTLTDLNTDGDSFKVYDNSTLILTTSTPLNNGTNCGNDPAVCVNDSYMSHGSVSVGAGSNVITIVDLTVNDQSPSGSAAFELTGNVSAVPEPTTLSLMGLGLGGLLLGWRRKRA